MFCGSVRACPCPPLFRRPPSDRPRGSVVLSGAGAGSCWIGRAGSCRVLMVQTPRRHGRLPRPQDLLFRETMVSVFAEHSFLFPVVALALAGVMVLLCRWAFSKAKGGSLVRRVDDRPAERDAFGLLT